MKVFRFTFFPNDAAQSLKFIFNADDNHSAFFCRYKLNSEIQGLVCVMLGIAGMKWIVISTGNNRDIIIAKNIVEDIDNNKANRIHDRF